MLNVSKQISNVLNNLVSADFDIELVCHFIVPLTGQFPKVSHGFKSDQNNYITLNFRTGSDYYRFDKALSRVLINLSTLHYITNQKVTHIVTLNHQFVTF